MRVIEDSCEALGAEYKGRKAGTLGDCGVFAFYPNKQITTGEGGMIITNDDHAADLMRALRNQGRAPGDTWLDHTYLGYNYRLDEMSAALGVSQMVRLEKLLTNRQQVADWYEHYLSGIDEVEAPKLVESTSRVSWFVYVVRLSKKIDRSHFAEVLKAKGIPVRPYFSPIHLQPFMRDMFGYGEGDYPVTEDLGARSLAVPFSGKMTEDEVAYVCQEIAKASYLTRCVALIHNAMNGDFSPDKRKGLILLLGICILLILGITYLFFNAANAGAGSEFQIQGVTGTCFDYSPGLLVFSCLLCIYNDLQPWTGWVGVEMGLA